MVSLLSKGRDFFRPTAAFLGGVLAVGTDVGPNYAVPRGDRPVEIWVQLSGTRRPFDAVRNDIAIDRRIKWRPTKVGDLLFVRVSPPGFRFAQWGPFRYPWPAGEWLPASLEVFAGERGSGRRRPIEVHQPVERVVVDVPPSGANHSLLAKVAIRSSAVERAAVVLFWLTVVGVVTLMTRPGGTPAALVFVAPIVVLSFKDLQR